MEIRARQPGAQAEIEGEIEIELEIGTVMTATPRRALSPHLPRWVLRCPAPPRLSPPSPRESAAPPRALDKDILEAAATITSQQDCL